MKNLTQIFYLIKFYNFYNFRFYNRINLKKLFMKMLKTKQKKINEFLLFVLYISDFAVI